MDVSALVSISGPTTVTRGGVSAGESNVDGYFNLSINKNDSTSWPMHLGLVIIPQTMTGDVCDRPPFLMNSSIPNDVLILGDDAPIWPKDFSNPYFFSKVSPNGVDYPSDGPWTVPWNGTHYYGMVNTNNTTVKVGTLYPTNLLTTSLKPGTYTYHLQSDFQPSVRGIDSADFNVTVTYGAVTIGAYNFTSLQPISAIQSGHNVYLQGINTDSDTTYLWLQGDGLPKCGKFLDALTVEDNPTDNKGAYMNGSWYYQWTAPCSSGTYTIYASSVNPSDVVLTNKYSREACSASCNEGGICGLLNCPTCGPTPASVSVLVTEPEFNFTIPSTIDRCCCAAFPCGSRDPVTSINLTGYTGIPDQPLRVYVFGNEYLYNVPYISGDFTTNVDSRGSFSLDLRTLFSSNGNKINFCDLDAGDYYVIIQMPGCNSSSFYLNKPCLNNNEYGYEAYKSVVRQLYDCHCEECTDKKSGCDRYTLLKFSIQDICNGGSVNFNASPTRGYSPLQVQFNDTSSYIGTNKSWDFGDGYSSTEQNPVHTYNSSGSYSVTLQVTNGTTSKKQKKYDLIKVSDIPAKYYVPTARFTYELTHNAIGGVQFIDQSVGSTPLTYQWNFGDSNNSVSDNESPLFKYRDIGEYNVTLTVIDQFGSVSSTTNSIDVAGAPQSVAPNANFTYEMTHNATGGVQFIDQSSGSGPLSYLWQFGDVNNSTSTNISPYFQYRDLGQYNVTLIISDPFNRTSTVILPVTVIGVPLSQEIAPGARINYTFVGNETNRTIQFSDESLNVPLSWNWNFGDNSSTSEKDPIHTYLTFGNYVVTLWVSNAGGTSSVSQNINLPAPSDSINASFSYTRTDFRTFEFTNNSTGSILTGELDFGDGTTPSPIIDGWPKYHAYTDFGNYNVRLTVSDGVHSSSVAKRVYVP